MGGRRLPEMQWTVLMPERYAASPELSAAELTWSGLHDNDILTNDLCRLRVR